MKHVALRRTALRDQRKGIWIRWMSRRRRLPRTIKKGGNERIRSSGPAVRTKRHAPRRKKGRIRYDGSAARRPLWVRSKKGETDGLSQIAPRDRRKGKWMDQVRRTGGRPRRVTRAKEGKMNGLSQTGRRRGSSSLRSYKSPGFLMSVVVCWNIHGSSN